MPEDWEKNSDLIRGWARPTCWYWRVSCRGKRWLWLWQGQRWQQPLWRVITGMSPPRDFHFPPRPIPTQQSVGSSAGTPQAKQPTGQEHSPTHQETGHMKSSQAWLCHQRYKIQVHTPAGRNQSLPLVNQYKALRQLHPPEVRLQKQEKLQPCSL